MLVVIRSVLKLAQWLVLIEGHKALGVLSELCVICLQFNPIKHFIKGSKFQILSKVMKWSVNLDMQMVSCYPSGATNHHTFMILARESNSVDDK